MLSTGNILSNLLRDFSENLNYSEYLLVISDFSGRIICYESKLTHSSKIISELEENSILIDDIYVFSETHSFIKNPFNFEINHDRYTLTIITKQHPSEQIIQLLTALFQEKVSAHITTRSIEKKFHESNQFTSTIINSLKYGVFATNPKSEILFVNDTACTFTQTSRNQLSQLHIDKLITNWQVIFKIISSGGTFINEEVSLLINNKPLKFSANVSPIKDLNDKLIGSVISIRELENVYQIVNKYTGMQARFEFTDIIAKSQVMKQLVEYAQKISDSPSTILIEGESGTGKEVFAQSIHNASSRKDSGFVAINCAAIPENLIESELFGYDDGAFTGARKGGHPGKFELANSGTIFLDEVGDMKPDMQVKLLRTLQEGTISRIGSDKIIPVDVRIIAATNKNLKEEVQAGRFRLDLYYRLSVIPLYIPPLRERKSDLPSLIRLFLNKKSVKLQKDIPQIRYSLLQQILEYNWPGNIRQLENFIEQLVNLNGSISTNYFSENQKSQPSTTHPKTPTNTFSDVPLCSLQEMEYQHIIRTIKACKNNLTLVAKTLQISRNTLYLKLKKYNINKTS